jgi:hypothetical protein
MRKSLVLATLVVLVCSAAAFAGVPDPSRSGCAVNSPPPAHPCQFFFLNDGTKDQLTLRVTLRDAFDIAVNACSTSCNLGGASFVGTHNCGGDRKVATTTAAGVVNFIYHCIGGHGTVQLRVTSQCGGPIGICSRTITFTNADLNGTQSADNGATNVADLGIWAGGLPPGYQLYSDYNCSGLVNVADLGAWAGGLGKTCANCP